MRRTKAELEDKTHELDKIVLSNPQPAIIKVASIARHALMELIAMQNYNQKGQLVDIKVSSAERWTGKELVQLVIDNYLRRAGETITLELARERANNLVTALMAKDLIA